jgi:hypothetical protein
MNKIHEKLDDATIRMSQVILLAGMLNDGSDVADPLRELLEDEDDKILIDCFPDMPAAILEYRDDEDMFKEEFASWAMRANKLGFLIQFGRPVMRYSADGEHASYSWGHYAQRWVYGDTLEEAIEKGLEWAAKREAAEKAKAREASKP